MERVRYRISLLLILALAVMTIAAAESGRETELLGMMNVARENASLDPVTLDIDLCEVARLHAADMINSKYFGHISPTSGTLASRLHKASIKYARAGENLAGDTSLAHAFDSWMDSPGHKGNVLGDFPKAGVAVVKGGPYGMMIVAVFTK
jgi:uncharacterized protein YkwD